MLIQPATYLCWALPRRRCPPQSLKHNPNGRFVTVCGDGEYVVYTALAWRNKSFGRYGEKCCKGLDL